jgi:MFS family permease
MRLPFLILLTSSGWAFSFGLGAPLASLWLERAGHAHNAIGWNHTAYYLGMAVAAALVPWLMGRWGRSCAAVGMIASGAAVAAFPLLDGLTGWFILRLLNGMAGALALIPLETYLNRDAPAEGRARLLGLYALAITLGAAAGNWLGLQVYTSFPYLAFAIGGAVAVLSGLIAQGGLRIPATRNDEETESATGTGGHFLSYGSAWTQGFLEGGMIAFLSIYLLSLHLNEHDISWMTTAVILGVIVFQVPIAWLADRLGRTAMLLACYGVVIGGLLLVPALAPGPALTLCLFLIGGCSGAFYPLGLALLGERLPSTALARANAGYLAVECIGCLIGPVVMGYLMDWQGEAAMFFTGAAALALMLGSWAVLQLAGCVGGSEAGAPVHLEATLQRTSGSGTAVADPERW